MKNNSLKFLIVLSTLCLVLVSCGDDEKKKANKLTIDDLKVEAGDVYLSQAIEGGDNDGYSLIVTSSGISTYKTEHDSDDFEGDGYVLFLYLKSNITTTLREGTYTFDSDGSGAYSLIWGQLNVLVEDVYSGFATVKSGTVKVSRSGSSYTITYSVIVEWDETELETTVTGYYSGKVKPAYILF